MSTLRRLWVNIRWGIAEPVGYWARPYDQAVDARRWRWQPRADCGFQAGRRLTDEQRAELFAAALRYARANPPTVGPAEPGEQG